MAWAAWGVWNYRLQHVMSMCVEKDVHKSCSILFRCCCNCLSCVYAFYHLLYNSISWQNKCAPSLVDTQSVSDIVTTMKLLWLISLEDSIAVWQPMTGICCYYPPTKWIQRLLIYSVNSRCKYVSLFVYLIWFVYVLHGSLFVYLI